MITKLRHRLTYANVMATVALFIALGGSSYAAVTLKRNSVKAKHIAKNAVTGKHIATNTVTTRKVRNRSLLSTDFKAGQLPTGAPGPLGPTGPRGAKGDPGSDAQFNGAAAGGHLTGTYPAPTVAPNALGGAEIQESTLGTVPNATNASKLGGNSVSAFARKHVAGGSFDLDDGASSPQVFTGPVGARLGLRVECVSSPSAGTRAMLINQTGFSMKVFVHDSTGAGIPFATVPDGFIAVSPTNTTVDTVQLVTFQIVGGSHNGTFITASLTRRSSGSPPCHGAGYIVD